MSARAREVQALGLTTTLQNRAAPPILVPTTVLTSAEPERQFDIRSWITLVG